MPSTFSGTAGPPRPGGRSFKADWIVNTSVLRLSPLSPTFPLNVIGLLLEGKTISRVRQPLRLQHSALSVFAMISSFAVVGGDLIEPCNGLITDRKCNHPRPDMVPILAARKVPGKTADGSDRRVGGGLAKPASVSAGDLIIVPTAPGRSPRLQPWMHRTKAEALARGMETRPARLPRPCASSGVEPAAAARLRAPGRSAPRRQRTRARCRPGGSGSRWSPQR